MIIKRNIANVITLLNLFSGSIAIILLLQNNFTLSVGFIILSCVFDFLDGMIARLINSISPIGKSLDSLSDMVSFGFYPGAVMYWLLQQSDMPLGLELFIPFAGFIITCFSALRLAIFDNDTRQSVNFIGLPTPANTLLIMSLPYILLNEAGHIIVGYSTLLTIVVLSSMILVAPIELFSLKIKNFSLKDNKFIYIMIAFAVPLFLIFNFKSIPIVILLYIILSIIKKILK